MSTSGSWMPSGSAESASGRSHDEISDIANGSLG
jgi:hypothetical protein